jgi:hypothetical protein
MSELTRLKIIRSFMQLFLFLGFFLFYQRNNWKILTEIVGWDWYIFIGSLIIITSVIGIQSISVTIYNLKHNKTGDKND